MADACGLCILSCRMSAIGTSLNICMYIEHQIHNINIQLALIYANLKN